MKKLSENITIDNETTENAIITTVEMSLNFDNTRRQGQPYNQATLIVSNDKVRMKSKVTVTFKFQALPRSFSQLEIEKQFFEALVEKARALIEFPDNIE